MVLVAPLAEELVWRGFSYPILKAKYGLRWGIILISLLASVLHVYNFESFSPGVLLLATALVFLTETVLTVIFEREGNLKWCFLFHSSFNLILLSVYVLSHFLGISHFGW